MSRTAAVLIAASLVVGTPAFAQQSEMENLQAGGDALLANHRETTQYSIDRATQALQARDFKTALRFARSVVRADPKRIESWKLLGAAQIGLQDWSGARRSYSSAVRISPGDPESRSGLGVATAYLNDPKAQEQLAWLAARVSACTSNCDALAGYQRQVSSALTASVSPSKTGRISP